MKRIGLAEDQRIVLRDLVGEEVERIRLRLAGETEVSSIYLVLKNSGLVRLNPIVVEVGPRLEVGVVQVAPSNDDLFEEKPFDEFKVGRKVIGVKLLEISDGNSVIESGIQLDLDEQVGFITVPHEMPFALAVQTRLFSEISFKPEYDLSNYVQKFV